VRTDDISIIALYVDGISRVGFGQSSSFFDNNKHLDKGMPMPSTASPTSATQSTSPIGTPAVAAAHIEGMEARPVRRVMSREKRKHMITLKEDDDDDDEKEGGAGEEEKTTSPSSLLLPPKNENEEQIILSAMRTNFLFQHLNVQQRNAVISVMKPVEVKTGDWIIRQGDAGDKFYIVDTGRYEVRVKPPPNPAPSPALTPTPTPTNRGKMSDEEMEKQAGNVVHIYESGLDQHPGFGELSLMYGKPRAASVIALTDGKLWSLDRKIFRKVVLRPKDFRREIIRTLKKVELLKCLNVTQLQRLTDLLNEKTFSAGEMIIRQGDPGDTFYLIERGLCECSINPNPATDPPGTPAKVVMTLKDHSYFGERALLESKPRAANVTAVTETRCLYIGKTAFEEVLGPLAAIIDDDRLRREAKAASEQLATVPRSLNEISQKGVASMDGLGPLLLGSFRSEMVTTRVFLLNDVMKNGLNDSVNRFLETARLLQQSASASANNNNKEDNKSALIPSLLAVFRQSNAIHLVFDSPVIADLSSFIRSHSIEFMENDSYLVYCFACIVAALERLHENNIIYRAVQPESLYLDGQGRVVLLDYRFCKLGLYGSSNRTFTICGASDYLAPEQISQIGHSYPVDLWGMGVLLYELSVGSHPFSSSTEVATYNKISSFGTKSFPALKFPDVFSNEIKSLINQLLVPTPEARIGAGSNGFHSLKKHAFFKSFAHWDSIHSANSNNSNSNGKNSGVSPVIPMAKKEMNELLQEKVDESLFRQFEAPLDPQYNSDWLKNLDL
jgi:CRP-like cAMP-binding protein